VVSEGSGKSLQTRALYQKLCRLNIPAVLIHEPGSTVGWRETYQTFKMGTKVQISLLFTELMLFNASRAQLMEEVVRPALKSRQRSGLADRFYRLYHCLSRLWDADWILPQLKV